MNKSIKLTLFFLTLCLGVNTLSYGQYNLSQPQGQGLHFGSMDPRQGGTITITEAGAVTYAGPRYYPLGTAARPAKFELTRNIFNYGPVSIEVEQTATLSRQGGGGFMTITNITQPIGRYSWVPFDFSTKTFFVGGTLNVSGNTLPGTYSGQYRVTIIIE